jgi:predicted AlkP superfamily phosphohydrolase/phosphomutase
MLLKYVDLNQGYIFAQNTSYLWAFLAFILGGILLFLKNFFDFFKRIFWIVVALLLVSAIIGGLIMHKKVNKNRVLVLGIDALDYTIAKDLIYKGLLPNLAQLARNGSFSPLASTIPSESIVAWSSFATGLNPANHGVYDFVMRKPKDYSLYLALNEMANHGGKQVTKLYRKGRPLWNILSRKNIQSYFYFCPDTFPADSLKGILLSGMGTTDILGNMGSFTFYTSKPLTDDDANSRGKIIHIDTYQDVINTNIIGPKFLKNNSTEALKIPLKIVLSANKQQIFLSFQGQNVSLKTNQWSQWNRIFFTAGPLNKLHGIIKFYLKSISPDLELYASPINLDPLDPPFAISYPKNYSKKLALKIGLYYTQGMPHDTWALSENRIDEKTFLEHTDEIFNEKEKILKEELKNFKTGLFFFYFDTLDAVQHMFWRYTDPEHPLYEKNSPYRDVIIDYYRKIDTLVGEILKNTDDQTLFLLMSDHGFSSFREAVHLNRWLLENGYLSLKESATQVNDFFEGVDWSKTQAYAIGFGGIYLNKKGREAEGIVTESESQGLKLKIKEGLLKLKNSKNQPAINHVYLQEDVFGGNYSADAPDLFVGFAKGFRASWQTAIGGVPARLIEDNRRKWSGDHLIDSVLVPGVIFINKKVKLVNPAIVDIAPTLLHMFGLDKTEKTDGHSLI